MIKRKKSPKEFAQLRTYYLLSQFGIKTFERFEVEMYQYLKKHTGKLTEKTVKRIETISSDIYRKELKHIKADLKEIISTYYKRLRQFKYKYRTRKGTIIVDLDAVDERMIKVLTDADLLWIMDHSSNTWAMRFITGEIYTGIERGLTGSEIAGVLKSKMADLTDKDPKLWNKRFIEDSYWRLVTSNTVSRTSSFANIHSMELAGVKQYKWVTRDDPCPICVPLDGKVFEVKDARGRIDEFIKATQDGDIEAMQTAMPFIDVGGEYEGLEPPAHHNCNCELEIV